MACRRILSDKFGQGDMQMLVAVTSERGAQSDAARAAGDDIVAQLKASPYVSDVTSAWTAPPSAAAGADQQGRQDGADRRRHYRG